jgi:phosphomannomutase
MVYFVSLKEYIKSMTLIKSISGIRGTIGGKPGEGFSPLDIVKFTSAYGYWLKKQHKEVTVVVGRDARISGPLVEKIVLATLQSLGINVINIGLSTTPTVEIAVPLEKAQGGIILTASHNPKQWNALKLLNHKGEFINGVEGEEVLRIADAGEYSYVEVDDLGTIVNKDDYFDIHIKQVIDYPLVDVEAIKKANLKVAVDAVNSSGGIVIPALLRALGVAEVLELYCEPNGQFPHNPEPLPENLVEIANLIKREKADVGVVVDPDVDRLALVCEDGSMFGEEYTLVAVEDYVLRNKKGNTVSNLSSTRALRDVTESNGGVYSPAAVGEVNVVEKMKEVNAVIGGEGNGGVIFPDLHYGRDALIGIALFLTHLVKSGKTVSELKASYPQYHISKNKIELTPEIDVDEILVQMEEKYKHENVNTVDGVKIDFEKEWVHLRKSNTEPIIRIYSESQNEEKANQLAQQIIKDIKEIISVKA